jgi:hypothetical protein
MHCQPLGSNSSTRYISCCQFWFASQPPHTHLGWQCLTAAACCCGARRQGATASVRRTSSCCLLCAQLYSNDCSQKGAPLPTCRNTPGFLCDTRSASPSKCALRAAAMAAGRALPVARMTCTPAAVAARMTCALSGLMLLLLSSSVPSMSRATRGTLGDRRLHTCTYSEHQPRRGITPRRVMELTSWLLAVALLHCKAADNVSTLHALGSAVSQTMTVAPLGRKHSSPGSAGTPTCCCCCCCCCLTHWPRCLSGCQQNCCWCWCCCCCCCCRFVAQDHCYQDRCLCRPVLLPG